MKWKDSLTKIKNKNFEKENVLIAYKNRSRIFEIIIAYPVFSSDPPSVHWPGSALLNLGDRMRLRTNIFSVIWS